MFGNRKSLVLCVIVCLFSLAAAIGWAQTQPARRIRERKKGQSLGERKPAVTKATTKYNDKATTPVKAAADKMKKDVEEKSAEVKAKTQDTCPMMDGQKIDKKYFADYQGKRVYFCCPGCVAAFNQNPEKIVKEMEAKGIQLEKAPAASEDTSKK